MPTYPNDADGDALRMLEEDGADLSKPMIVDFMIAVRREDSAKEIAEAAAVRGYKTAIVRESDDNAELDDRWTVYCTKTMLLTYEAAIASQAELDALAAPFDGYTDGWGSFGNHQ